MTKRLLAASALASLFAFLQPGVAEAHLAGTVYRPVYRHIASYDCTGIWTDLPDFSETTAQFECEATVTAFDVLCEDDCGKVKRINATDQCVSQVTSSFITEENVVCEEEEKECKDDGHDNDRAAAKGGHHDDEGDHDCVEICHVPKGNPDNAHTICVDEKAAKKHIKRHGDSLGACEADECTATTTSMLPQTVLEEAGSLCSNLGKKWSVKDELVKSVQVRLRSFECFDVECAEREQAYEAVLNCTLPAKYDIKKNPPPGDGVATDYDCEVVAESHCDVGEGCPIQVDEVCVQADDC